MLMNAFRSDTRGNRKSYTWTKRFRREQAGKRQGSAAVFGLLLIISLVVLMGVTLDFGNIRVTQAEMRRAADAGAMAACWEMYDVQSQQGVEGHGPLHTAAWEGANDITSHNVVGDGTPRFHYYDVLPGAYDATTGEFDHLAANRNAVQVTLRRQSWINGELTLLFGALTGRETQSLRTTATAAMFSQIVGFNEPESGENIGILPIALDLPTWEDAVNGLSDDVFAFHGDAVDNGSDGVSEANLYPQRHGGSRQSRHG